jgi:GNAT superfamily N-acetyltransferase
VDEDSETVLGFGRMSQPPWTFHPQKFFIDVLVDPRYQGRGLGSRIYEKLVRDLEELHATVAWAWIKENVPRSLTFAGKRGFVEKRRAWESRLNPSEVDAGRFQTYADRVSKDGIRISTLAEEEAKGRDALRGIHELAQACWADVPLQVPYTPMSFEQWEAKELKNPNQISDGYFIASDGRRYVGYSNVWRRDKEPRTLWQYMTGVRREYRGRGIAMALKLKIVDYARGNGYDKIVTLNDSDNAPMLAVNTKLGFKREVGWITLEKNLEETHYQENS